MKLMYPIMDYILFITLAVIFMAVEIEKSQYFYIDSFQFVTFIRKALDTCGSMLLIDTCATSDFRLHASRLIFSRLLSNQTSS